MAKTAAKAKTTTAKPKAASPKVYKIDAAFMRELFNAQNDTDGCMYIAKDTMAEYINHVPPLVEFHEGMKTEEGKGKAKVTKIAFRLTQDGINRLGELESDNSAPPPSQEPNQFAAMAEKMQAIAEAPAPAPPAFSGTPQPPEGYVPPAAPVPAATDFPMGWVANLPVRKRGATKNSKYKFKDLEAPRPDGKGGQMFHSFYVENTDEVPDAPRALSSAVANYKKQFGTPNGKYRKGKGGVQIPLMDYTIDFEVYSVFGKGADADKVIGAACYRIK